MFVIDTNILLDNPDIVSQRENIVIPSAVLEELDGLKKSDQVGYRARCAIRAIRQNRHNIKFDVKDIYKGIPETWECDKRDNKIVMCSKEYNSTLLTNDVALQIKADSLGIDFEECDKKEGLESLYNGYDYVELTHEEQCKFYTGEYELPIDLYINQYVLIKDKDTGEVIDKFKMTENGLDNIKYRTVSNSDIGKVKPLNLQQELAFDMLQDSNILVKMIAGGFGTGKDYIMLTHAIDLIKNGKFDKLIWIRNTVEVKNSKPIGFLKGSLQDKLLPFSLVLADKLGGLDGLNMFIERGKIELQHLGFLRGRDFKNCILYCTESENLTKEHVQLILGRVGENSILMMNGDYRQVDERVFETNNGFVRAIESLMGNKIFGYIKLDKVERSETARLADLLD